jgi:rod shape-determining protein MreC
MFHAILRYRKLLLLVAILAGTLLWMATVLRQPTFWGWEGAGGALAALTAPIQNGLTAVTQGASRIWHHYLWLAGAAEENARLRDEVALLQQELLRTEAIHKENQRLHALVDLKSSLRVRSVTAAVIGREATRWFRLLTINKGSEEGIAPGMAAAVPQGIVGRVAAAYAHSSQVILLTDPGSAVAVRLQRSREEGILEGRGGPTCRLKYLLQSADAQAGDLVVTSGLDGIFPPGLLVGEIRSAGGTGEGLFQQVTVTPSAPLDRLEEVLVITDMQRGS